MIDDPPASRRVDTEIITESSLAQLVFGDSIGAGVFDLKLVVKSDKCYNSQHQSGKETRGEIDTFKRIEIFVNNFYITMSH